MCRNGFVAGVLWLTAAAWAQDDPTRAVRIVVPFATGGPADVYARFIGQRLQAALGQPFVIENKPRAGAITGTQEAAQAAPDGYTLLMMSTHTVNEILYTPSVTLVGQLPRAFELATVYSAAVTAGAASPEAAVALVQQLTSPAVAALRRAGGFESV